LTHKFLVQIRADYEHIGHETLCACEGSFAPEADSSIDWAAGIEEIRQSPDRQHIDGGHTIALKAEGSGAGVVIPKWRLISSYRLADHACLKD
jgi:hypothetical protein